MYQSSKNSTDTCPRFAVFYSKSLLDFIFSLSLTSSVVISLFVNIRTHERTQISGREWAISVQEIGLILLGGCMGWMDG